MHRRLRAHDLGVDGGLHSLHLLAHRVEFGFAHGGVISYIADNALTFAGAIRLGTSSVTAEMKINYIRPAIGDHLIARAQAISGGRSQAVTRCDVFVVSDGEEKLCAAAQATIVALPKQQA